MESFLFGLFIFIIVFSIIVSVFSFALMIIERNIPDIPTKEKCSRAFEVTAFLVFAGIILVIWRIVACIVALFREEESEVKRAELEHKMDNLSDLFRNITTSTSDESITELITRYLGR